MQRVVSVTPLAVERDSRTFRQAASVARLGYESVVVERYSSGLNQREIPFRLQHLERQESKPSANPIVPDKQSQVGGISNKLVRWLGRLTSHLPGALYFLDRLYWCGLRTFLTAPKAPLYYLHAFYQFPAVQLRCWIHRARFIYDAHDFYSDLHEGPDLSWMYQNLRVPFERWLESTCIRWAAAVVTVSEGVAALQQQKFGCRPVVIRNCEDRRLQRAPSVQLREATGVGPTDFLFAVLGNAKRGQALSEMLEALTVTPANVHVACLGLGYEQLETQIHALGLEARVHLIPPVRPFEVVPFIADADASLLLYYPRSANYLHCLPNGFFQAIAAGLPLLYPELPEVGKLARAYRLGLPIDPRSPASIAEGMLAFVQQPDRLEVYRRNAEQARDTLSWEREEVVLGGLLARALHGPPAGRR